MSDEQEIGDLRAELHKLAAKLGPQEWVVGLQILIQK